MTRSIYLASALFLFLTSCAEKAVNISSPSQQNTVTAVVTPSPAPSQPIKNGDYAGKGKVTKINTTLGSIGLDHEEIVGVMPPMRMEFYVTDKMMLEGLEVGDQVDFMLRYKDATEKIIELKKTK